MDVALAIGAFAGFSALWLVAVAADAGEHGRASRRLGRRAARRRRRGRGGLLLGFVPELLRESF